MKLKNMNNVLFYEKLRILFYFNYKHQDIKACCNWVPRA